MTCAEFLERYTDFRDGLITAPRELRRFTRHLALCPACRRYDAALRRGVLALQSIQSIEPSPAFRRRLDARLARERRRGQGPARAGIAAALFVAAALAMVTLEGVRRPPIAQAPALPRVPFPRPVAPAGVPFVSFPAARDFNLDQRSAPELDAEAFHALVNTPPMLATRRAVVVRGLEQLKKTAKLRQELLRYLESPNPTTLLVLVQAAGEAPDAELVRRTTAVVVEPLPPARVERWMAHRAGQLALTLAPEAGALLLDAVGSDLAALARELEKLAALGGGGSRPATREDVAALVGVRRGETLQDLVDATLERRAADAARLVAPILEQAGMSGVRML